MHNARHDARHAQQGEVLLRHIDGEGEVIGGMGKDKAGDASQIQTRCENTTTATSCVGRAGGEHLGEQDQNQEEYHSEIGVVQPIEKALIHDVRELPV